MKTPLLRILPLLLLVGCGDGGNWTDENVTPGIPGNDNRSTDTLDRQSSARSIPVVYIDRLAGQKGKFTYRIQGEKYEESAFLGLCRTMVRDNPGLHLRIVLGAVLSDDEVGLITARIREAGVPDITVLNSNGEERR